MSLTVGETSDDQTLSGRPGPGWVWNLPRTNSYFAMWQWSEMMSMMIVLVYDQAMVRLKANDKDMP